MIKYVGGTEDIRNMFNRTFVICIKQKSLRLRYNAHNDTEIDRDIEQHLLKRHIYTVTFNTSACIKCVPGVVPVIVCCICTTVICNTRMSRTQLKQYHMCSKVLDI